MAPEEKTPSPHNAFTKQALAQVAMLLGGWLGKGAQQRAGCQVPPEGAVGVTVPSPKSNLWRALWGDNAALNSEAMKCCSTINLCSGLQEARISNLGRVSS